jgi:hypothetical protein
MQHASKPNNPLFITVEEAAALLEISRTLAYELTRRYLITHESGLPCLRLRSRRIDIQAGVGWSTAAMVGALNWPSMVGLRGFEPPTS